MENETNICDEIQDIQEKEACKRSARIKRIRSLIVLVSIFGIVVLLYFALPYKVGMTIGDSMFPTMQPKHLFVMNTNPFSRTTILRSDVVVFEQDGETIVKRVYGVGTDMIWILSTHTGIDVIPANRVDRYKYAIAKMNLNASLHPLIIPRGRVFVLGDNYNNSEDSRDYGPIPVSEIIGKVVYIENWKALNFLRRPKA